MINAAKTLRANQVLVTAGRSKARTTRSMGALSWSGQDAPESVAAAPAWVTGSAHVGTGWEDLGPDWSTVSAVARDPGGGNVRVSAS